ncbi:MAG: 4-(cytidine 5'-diphospho)-2-C-methyl-D-erythritol kinase [Bacilli bacterium]|nr:4-(cytidine 5'-diphospho)-2-C-methyl-D-erythritol kinase [Bacilli bacterium]
MKRHAYAKINLNLIIKNKIEDGKHLLESVFHKISLCDDIEIEENVYDKCVLTCNIKELENDNLILKAYEMLKEEYEIPGLDVKLTKRIPMQAGLGGGSSDVATFILMVNEYFDLKLTFEELNVIGKSLGSDVVPCYYDQPVLGEGIGNVITPIISNLDFNLVVIKPDLECSTGLMYKKLDEIKDRDIPDNTNQIIKSLNNNDLELLVNNLFNSFEEVVDCKEIKKDLIDSGAIGTLLCGSGSCVFGIYRNKKEAEDASKILSNKYLTYVCESINN